ncbi:hypothetical protein [Kitasatospora sp. NPDC093102]|uniref:hypothetical protein n=1 Tax=Kitasatospora sp. NPDC093102 TaxID=3155069 RepID=UPI003432AF79
MLISVRRGRSGPTAGAQVDGIIAGYGAFTGVREYDNTWQGANAVNLVRDWVKRHSGTYRMATSGDRLFK